MPRVPVFRSPLALLLVTLTPACGSRSGGGSASSTAGLSSTAAGSSALAGLDVAIDAPADASHQTAGRITVEGRVGPDAVEVRVGGQPARVEAGSFRAEVDLSAGLNALEVVARDAAGGENAGLLSLLAGDVRPEGDAVDGAGEVRLTGSGAAARAGAIGAPAAGPAAGFPPMRWIAADPTNFTPRSGPRAIRWIVIHTLEGSEAGCISWMRNPVSDVSAHYVLSRAGRVTQMVRDEDVAWHVRAQNPQAIGIENEGYAGQNLWTDVQYETLARLVRALADKHGVPRDRQHIVGHGELPGQTHWDPGPHFDWARFMRLVNAPRGGGAPAARTRRMVSPEGVEVELALEVAPTAGDTSGRSVVLGARTRALAPVKPAFPGALLGGGSRASLGGRSGPDWDVALGVHQDAIAHTLLAAWRGGALELRLDGTRLAALAPAATGALEAQALIARDPALAGIVQAGEQLELRLSADLPPVPGVAAGAPQPLELGLGALRLEVGAFHPLRSERRRLGRLDLALTGSCEVLLAGDDAALRPTGAGAIACAVAGAEPGVDRALLRQLGRALAPAVLEACAGALRGVAIPVPEGLGLRPVRAEAEGKTLLLLGR